MKLNPLKPLLLPVILIAIFIAMAFNVSLFMQFDSAAIQLASHLPRSWQPFLETISHLGDFHIDVFIIIAIAIWELARRNYIRSLVTALCLLAFPLFFFVKETVSRARPTGDFIIASNLPGYSFPSGHAVTSAVTFGIIAILCYSHLKKPWKYIAFGLCLAIIFLIGVSRVYLGAHFPTDVVAGWLLALGVLSGLRALSIFVAQRTTHRVSDTTEDPESITN